jgi:glycosyltransferase involved in cell wall biosynthesis
MKICIIAEGSYPYITGGVSSWIHSIITRMPEHQFVIYAIGAYSKQKGQYKYKLPENIVEVKEIFLDAYMFEDGEWGQRFRLTNSKKKDIRALLGGEGNVDWNNIFNLLRSKKFQKVADFLSSKDYFDILEDLCRSDFNLVPFTEMFWTVRSMILPLFLTIRHEVPQADLYHSVSTGYAGVIGALAKHVHDKPFILTEHGIYSREREEEIIKADWVKGYFKDLWIEYFYRLSSCAYESADRVITLFGRNKEIEIELGCDPGKISIIPNGVNTEDYKGLSSVMEDGIIRIGAVVRVVPIKDIKTMLQSFLIVKREVPNAELYVMGPIEEDDEYYLECLSMVKTLELEDVHFTGEVNIKDYLGRMDVLLLTSVSEGQPLAVLEGMACAKPFVTTNVGSCKELLAGLDDGIGPAGLVAPVMHYEQIGQALIQLCKDRNLREEMGQNGLERVQRYYKHKDFISSYRHLYQSLGGMREWQESASS